MTHLPELALAVICGLILLTFCLCEWVKWWRARRDERDQQTDSDIRAFLAYGYKRGWTTRSWRDRTRRGVNCEQR